MGGCRNLLTRLIRYTLLAFVFLVGLSIFAGVAGNRNRTTPNDLPTLVPSPMVRIADLPTITNIVIPTATFTSEVPSPTFTPFPNPTRTAAAALLQSNNTVPTIAASATITDTPEVVASATNSAETLGEKLEAALPGIQSFGVVTLLGNSYYAEITTFPNFNKQSFAELVLIEALRENVFVDDFTVIIDDTVSAPLAWNWRNNEWSSNSVATGLVANVPTSTPPTPRATATPAPEGRTISKTVYPVNSINARSCPSTTCERVTQFPAGLPLNVDYQIEGEEVNNGNVIWYRTKVNGDDVYVYSGLVSDNTPVLVQPPVSSGSSSSSSSSSGNISVAPPVAPPVSGASCNGASTCGEMSSCEQAYACLYAGDGGLDRDNDGVPCESICPGG